MSKETLVFIIGILLILVPFLGIPETWRQYTIAAGGALLMIVGYAMRRAVYMSRLEGTAGERSSDSFVETTEQLFR